MIFAFETPTSYLKTCDEIQDYHYLLAHMLLKDKDYASFYKQSKKYKILDNSCAELGKSIPTDELIKSAIDYQVNILVLPDTWMKGESTLIESNKALDDIKVHFPKEYERLRFMFVVQGRSYQEFMNTFNLFIKQQSNLISQNRIIIGLPYLTCARIMSLQSPFNRDDDVTNARIKIIQLLNNFDIDYHLLGSGFNYSQEISFMRHYSRVKSTDTSAPFILALNGVELDKRGLYDRVINKSGSLDFNLKYDKKIAKLAMYNGSVIKSFSEFYI